METMNSNLALQNFDPETLQEIEDLEIFVVSLIHMGADGDIINLLLEVSDIVPWWDNYMGLSLRKAERLTS
jgi:hypothetical protein